jgi:hypothetical protein
MGDETTVARPLNRDGCGIAESARLRSASCPSTTAQVAEEADAGHRRNPRLA